MKLTASFALSCLMLAGCEAYQVSWEAYDCSLNSGYCDLWGAPLDTGAGELMGDYGDSQLTQPTSGDLVAWHSTWGGYDVTTVELTSSDDQGWLSMAIVEIYGGMQELQPGQEASFYIDDDSASAGAFVLATGCSGFDPYMWTNDELAEQVTVRVEDQPTEDGLLRAHFTAYFATQDWKLAPTFPPERTTLTGTFEIAKPAHRAPSTLY